MKRVAGLPGETVQIKQGRLILNGKALNAPAPLAAPDFEIPGMAFPGTNGSDYVIPDKCYFVLGDNGTNSLDSWHFGTISCKSVLGKATKIYWPWRHAGDIR